MTCHFHKNAGKSDEQHSIIIWSEEWEAFSHWVIVTNPLIRRCVMPLYTHLSCSFLILVLSTKEAAELIIFMHFKFILLVKHHRLILILLLP